MDSIELIKKLALGAFVGCFIVMLVMVLFSISNPNNVNFSGVDIINAFLGSIIVGWGFSLTGFVYDRDDLALPLQVLFQMGIGFIILFVVAVYLHWMPINLGIGPIVTWVIIAFIFGAVFWCSFYIYNYILARRINKKLSN